MWGRSLTRPSRASLGELPAPAFAGLCLFGTGRIGSCASIGTIPGRTRARSPAPHRQTTRLSRTGAFFADHWEGAHCSGYRAGSHGWGDRHRVSPLHPQPGRVRADHDRVHLGRRHPALQGPEGQTLPALSTRTSIPSRRSFLAAIPRSWLRRPAWSRAWASTWWT